MYLISGNGTTADWYRNLDRIPQVDVLLAGETLRGVARAVTDPPERRRCGHVMRAKYVWGGDAGIGLSYDNCDAWCSEVPAVAITF